MGEGREVEGRIALLFILERVGGQMVVEEFDLTDTSVEQECFGWLYKAKVFDSSELDCTCVCVWCMCVWRGGDM